MTVKETRTPLSRQRVLEAAIDLADRDGIEAVTMRSLAESLGVEAMSLYHHVENKEAILSGAIDLVVDEINEAVAALDIPDPTVNWKMDMRAMILAARDVLLTHPWAPPVIETRSSLSLPVITYHDRLLGLMVQGGFSYDLSHHALHALGSRAMGFSQELFQPAPDEEDSPEILAEMAEKFPNIVGMLEEVSHDPTDPSLGWCDDQTEFEFAIDLLLDGLERLNTRST